MQFPPSAFARGFAAPAHRPIHVTLEELSVLEDDAEVLVDLGGDLSESLTDGAGEFAVLYH